MKKNAIIILFSILGLMMTAVFYGVISSCLPHSTRYVPPAETLIYRTPTPTEAWTVKPIQLPGRMYYPGDTYPPAYFKFR
ncbi:MAG: hypothetical protein IKS31_01535 [Clostridia bacterium]|nr:hypothetical protein [Clostridia bacterium]